MSRIYYYFKQILFYLFLGAYVFLLAKSLLFKQVPLAELFNADRVINRTLTLIPFKTISEYLFGDLNIWVALMNLVGNIVLFIPLGLYLQIFMRNKKILNCVVLVFAVSLCVEAVQYIFGLGSTDIDDIILNVFGGLLGIFIYKIIYLMLKDENKTKTAITYLFGSVAVCLVACFLVLTNLSGMRIKIF